MSVIDEVISFFSPGYKERKAARERAWLEWEAEQCLGGGHHEIGDTDDYLIPDFTSFGGVLDGPVHCLKCGKLVPGEPR